MSKPTCATCTAACCREEAMLFGDTGIPSYMTVGDSEGRVSMKRLEDGKCIALDRKTFRCTIYDTRPWICREFEEGGADCRELWTEKGSCG